MRCDSYESHWQAPAGSVFDDDLRPPEPRASDDVALRVERAVVAAGRVFAAALAMTYVNGLPLQVVGRRLGVPDAGPVLDAAHQAVAARLR